MTSIGEPERGKRRVHQPDEVIIRPPRTAPAPAREPDEAPRPTVAPPERVEVPA